MEIEIVVPKTSEALMTLLRADFTTQWRNRRAVIMTLVVPVIILMSWKPLVPKFGGPFVLANAITIGMFASGLMGYANAVARDRDRGIFQRLRVAPLPSWTIIASRLLVQLAMIFIVTTAVFIIAKNYDQITLTPAGYVVTYVTAILGGAIALSMGQMVVGYIKNPETVNSTTRLIYIAFIVIGMFGEFKQLGNILDNVVIWSPYGVMQTILSAGMEPTKWNSDATTAFLATIGYIAIFTVLGVKWFRWNTK